ncbi:MAG: divalent-cation tolerance protein CutA [Gammaproteobacteria bacterium]
MTDKVVVYVTSRDAEESEKISRSLVEKRLAACVNVISPVRSFYRWEGKVQDDPEYLMVIKTSRALFPAVRVEVERLHSYHVPEVICVPIVEGSENYLTWLGECLKED